MAQRNLLKPAHCHCMKHFAEARGGLGRTVGGLRRTREDSGNRQGAGGVAMSYGVTELLCCLLQRSRDAQDPACAVRELPSVGRQGTTDPRGWKGGSRTRPLQKGCMGCFLCPLKPHGTPSCLSRSIRHQALDGLATIQPHPGKSLAFIFSLDCSHVLGLDNKLQLHRHRCLWLTLPQVKVITQKARKVARAQGGGGGGGRGHILLLVRRKFRDH